MNEVEIIWTVKLVLESRLDVKNRIREEKNQLISGTELNNPSSSTCCRVKPWTESAF